MAKKHKFDAQDEEEAILRSIRRIAELLQKTPTQKEYKQNSHKGEFSLEQILYRFGRWSTAVKKAGLKPNAFQKPPRHNIISEQDLIEEFIRVANMENKIPGLHFFRANAKYSWTPYKTKWGSWKSAVDYICNNFSDRLKFNAENMPRKKSVFKRKSLKIDCAILYEPSNEYETIALFSILAKELGFQIKRIQADFPDGIVNRDGKEILVEFEYLSSNYIQHGHPLEFKGICICWRNDCELGNIEIIALEEYIRKHFK